MGARFDAVLFDAGGVLVLPDPKVLAPLIAYYGGDDRHEAYVRAHYAGMAAKSAVTAGESDWTHYNETYLAHLSVPAEHRDAALEVLTHVKSNARLWRHPIPGSAEALRALDEGIVRDGRDVDLAVIHALGFPAFRGGLLAWADTLGAVEVVRRLEPLADLGPRMLPPPRLVALAREEGRFSEPVGGAMPP